MKSPETCPVCGATYSALRTGLTYSDVYLMLWSPSEDPSEWVYKRRHTVLGKWRQIKLELWDYHLTECERYQKAPSTAESGGGIVGS